MSEFKFLVTIKSDGSVHVLKLHEMPVEKGNNLDIEHAKRYAQEPINEFSTPAMPHEIYMRDYYKGGKPPEPFTDNDLSPWGQYKGQRLGDLPDDYFENIYNKIANGMVEDPPYATRLQFFLYAGKRLKNANT